MKIVIGLTLAVSIPSDRGIRSGSDHGTAQRCNNKSQSPLIGAFVPGNSIALILAACSLSQSPLIGAFVPGNNTAIDNNTAIESQSPLIGAFVPGRPAVCQGSDRG